MLSNQSNLHSDELSQSTLSVSFEWALSGLSLWIHFISLVPWWLLISVWLIPCLVAASERGGGRGRGRGTPPMTLGAGSVVSSHGPGVLTLVTLVIRSEIWCDHYHHHWKVKWFAYWFCNSFSNGSGSRFQIFEMKISWDIQKF